MRGHQQSFVRELGVGRDPIPPTRPHTEADPLDLQASGTRDHGGRCCISGAVDSGITGNRRHCSALWTSLRAAYWNDTAPGAPSSHVDAAAWAALLSTEKARSGIFNIAELMQPPLHSEGGARAWIR